MMTVLSASSVNLEPSRRDWRSSFGRWPRQRRSHLMSRRRSALPDFDLGALGWNAALAEQLEPGLIPGRVDGGAPCRLRRPKRSTTSSAPASPGGSCTRTPMSRSGTGSAFADGLIRTVLPALERARAERCRGARRWPRPWRRTSTSRSSSARSARSSSRGRLGALSRDDLGERRDAGDRADEVRPARGSVADGRRVEAVALGVPVHGGVVSSVTGQGLDALRARIQPGTTAVLVGSSGCWEVDAREPVSSAGADGG